MHDPQRLSVPIRLERSPSAPLQDQLVDQLRSAIDTGRLAPGTRMPSTRTMSSVLRVSRGVVVAAYEVLFAHGYVTGRTGSGTYVSASSRREERTGHPAPTLPDPAPRRPPPLPATAVRMLPDLPSPEGFPLAAWRAAWRDAGHRQPPADEPPPAGLPELRHAIAAHLRDSRGPLPDGHEVIVAAGYGHAVQLILLALGKRPVIGLENPAPAPVRTALSRHGTVLPVPVDGAGARVDLVPTACDVLVVMPDRGEPLGTRMTPERREEVAAWAARRGTIVIEPAFDGVFDARLSPRPGLMAVGDPSLAVMVGTFCDVLTPALRLAFIVAPRFLAAAIEELIAAGREQPPYPSQQAAATLLTSGCVSRRVERLSALYAPRRALVAEALGVFPRASLLGADSGSAATLVLPDGIRAEVVARALRERQVQVAELSRYHHPAGPYGNGLVIGHGHLEELTLRRALRVVVRTLVDHGLARRNGPVHMLGLTGKVVN